MPSPSDGSRLFFTYEGDLYVRLNPGKAPSPIVAGVCTEPELACTVAGRQIPRRGRQRWRRTSNTPALDGSKVFFTDASKLTANSTAVAGKEDLYEYDTETGTLTDLTVNASEPANVWAAKRRVSEDGSYVYFVAEAALKAAGATTPGNCEHYLRSQHLQPLRRARRYDKYIAALSVDDAGDFKGERHFETPHNGHLVEHHGGAAAHPPKLSQRPLLLLPTTKNLTGEGTGVYLYDVGDRRAAPLGGERVQNSIEPTASEAASFFHKHDEILDNGTVFFDTKAALVPAGCQRPGPMSTSTANGEYFLLSPGTDPSPSALQRSHARW